MSRSTANASAERLLHASPHRTVFVTVDPATGERLAAKVFVAGSTADAERETEMATLCAGPGVVRYLPADEDPVTGRPRTRTVFVDGLDLDQLVAAHGAVPAATACRLLAPAADALAAMHTLCAPAAPHGIAHGDVKPKNLLRTSTTTLLLDFEHAHALPPPVAGATHGAADVNALASTLRWLLSGGGLATLPQHEAVNALLERCEGRTPPPAATVATILRELAERLDDDPDEALLDAAARGDASAGTPARAGLARFLTKTARIRRTLPHLLAAAAPLIAEPAAILRALRTTLRLVKHFPRHEPTWRRLETLRGTTGRMLAEAATRTADRRRAEEFTNATLWLTEVRASMLIAAGLPGGCPVPQDGPARMAGLLQRDPLAHLHQLAAQVDDARSTLAAEIDAIVNAENRLDLDVAERRIEAMAANYGGSSPSAARCRDRLHRLAFYLDRIARAQPNVERIGSAWDAVALKPLTEFVASASAAGQRRPRTEGGAGVVGLRSLQITLVNLGEEFPDLPKVAPAVEALNLALAHTTDHAWQLLGDAEKCLRTIPVPVRPLQVALSRLDTYRILEALVDRPGRPRSTLLDALEGLRLRLDQARATRDRLTEGAEQAMARGHWTTGLFDMERAVADIDPVDETDRAEAARLTARLAEARRRKQEVDTAVRRNVELATRYATLQDDPSSSFEDRLQALADRRECLRLLATHAPAERAVLYSGDLRDLATQTAIEETARAEHRIDGTVDPFERLRIARETVDRLAGSETGTGAEPSGRVVRLLEHWRTVASHCQLAVDRVHDAAKSERRQRRRLWRVGAAAALASAGAIVLALWPWLTGSPARAGGRGDGASFDRLAVRAAALPASVREGALGLVRSARAANDDSTFDAESWSATWAAELRAFAQRSDDLADRSEAYGFAVACWDAALLAARSRVDIATRDRIDRDSARLAEELGSGLRPSR
ncbi:MAG: hypothetical protein JNK78_16445 [Planctomycetes bacterium]|nr:hypothetical protein [Planctomycetota bacterium]